VGKVRVEPKNHWYSSRQGLKKCKFPGKLVKISHGPQVKDDRPLWLRKSSLFSCKHCTQET